MAKLTPDATRTEHGLVINEKIIPWGAVWPKDSGAYKKGAQYKADRLLSGGTGKVKGVTIHNTNDLKNVEEDAEQYTRATWPNANMNDARVHYYVDDINAWQNLREDEVGWHAGDGRKATGGNETTLSIEIVMDGSGSKEDLKAEENGVLLAALLLKKHGLSVNELYTHNHWMGHPDSIVQGARKNCPLYILPHWAQFKQKVAAKLTELNGGATTTETGKTEIMGKAKASAQQMALFARSKNAEPQLPACSLEQLAQFFLEEGEAEGVRGDVAFAQSLHETGFFKYGGIVLPTQNNYAGIGALNGNATGQAATFPDPRTGVRAQIQHLKAYASTEPLVNACVDPRFSLVTRGSAPYVEWLGAADNPNGKGWAVPGSGYGANVVKLLSQIMAQEAPESPSPAPEPDPLANYPDWQRNGLTALVKAGVINSPDYWANKFGEAIKVGEIIGILGKMMEQPTE
jgi:N-acetylmuramoyl-L-alanine amidase CwlA